ncbi:MAG: hypothetical protein J3K34DRAFT_420738 [Monoraphidium minutum]|nr:MAG: hypothetical protein J3K34DRAFT_420738 [Monoraphidium minutum]
MWKRPPAAAAPTRPQRSAPGPRLPRLPSAARAACAPVAFSVHSFGILESCPEEATRLSWRGRPRRRPRPRPADCPWAFGHPLPHSTLRGGPLPTHPPRPRRSSAAPAGALLGGGAPVAERAPAPPAGAIGPPLRDAHTPLSAHFPPPPGPCGRHGPRRLGRAAPSLAGNRAGLFAVRGARLTVSREWVSEKG